MFSIFLTIALLVSCLDAAALGAISTNSTSPLTCGRDFNITCPDGQCCSPDGKCYAFNSTSPACGVGCQPNFGMCAFGSISMPLLSETPRVLYFSDNETMYAYLNDGRLFRKMPPAEITPIPAQLQRGISNISKKSIYFPCNISLDFICLQKDMAILYKDSTGAMQEYIASNRNLILMTLANGAYQARLKEEMSPTPRLLYFSDKAETMYVYHNDERLFRIDTNNNEVPTQITAQLKRDIIYISNKTITFPCTLSDSIDGVCVQSKMAILYKDSNGNMQEYIASTHNDPTLKTLASGAYQARLKEASPSA